MLSIIQLLLLKLKQECFYVLSKDKYNNKTLISFSIEELLSNPISSIGNKFKKHWKIGIH